MELRPLQRLILDKLSKSPLQKYFYWTGGTALSFFYLHHRLSFDIDLFSDKPFRYSDVIAFVKEIARKTKLKKIEEKKIFDRWEFFLRNKENLRLEFAYYGFPALKPRKKWKCIFVDSLDDLAANKTMALIERYEPKDVFDIYCLIQERHFTPARLLKLVEKKFGAKFSLSLFWSQGLLASKGLKEIKPMLSHLIDKEKHIKEVREFFSANAARFIKNILI